MVFKLQKLVLKKVYVTGKNVLVCKKNNVIKNVF